MKVARGIDRAGALSEAECKEWNEALRAMLVEVEARWAERRFTFTGRACMDCRCEKFDHAGELERFAERIAELEARLDRLEKGPAQP